LTCTNGSLPSQLRPGDVSKPTSSTSELVEFSNLQFKVLNADSRSIRLLQVTPTLESRAI
ncbi:MAG: hypothetical protein COB04_18845, partial [Gammaproteobacteria bacterium]